MVPLYIFALLIHTAFSNTPCKNGVEIVTKETHNPEDLIGDWTYVYQWYKPRENYPIKVVKTTPKQNLLFQKITVVSPDLVKAKEAKCANSKEPFNWSDAKLTFFSNIVFMGEKENWVMYDCEIYFRMVPKIVSDDYMVIIYPEKEVIQLFSRKAPISEELNCLVDNVDVGKGMAGPGFYTE